MSRLASVTVAGRRRLLADLPCPLSAEQLFGSDLPSPAGWHLEIGCGKGRFLLSSARAAPQAGFIGIEMVARYARLLAGRAARQRVENLAVIHGEALYLLATHLPWGFADSLHIYFPDPWPKSRHHRRRLLDAATVDLVLGVLKPGGRLNFATDYLDYGEAVVELLENAPSIAEIRCRRGEWPDGVRTNWEGKFMTEGRPILRLEAERAVADVPCLHPLGRDRILAATADAPSAGAEDDLESNAILIPRR